MKLQFQPPRDPEEDDSLLEDEELDKDKLDEDLPDGDELVNNDEEETADEEDPGLNHNADDDLSLNGDDNDLPL